MNATLQSVLAAAASFLFVTVLFAFLLLLFRFARSFRRRRHPRTRHRTAPNPSTELSAVTVDESASFDPSLNRVSMEELRVATKNFSPDLIIGDGSFGLVYKAELPSSISSGGGGVTTVAIKKLDPDAFQGLREFRAEMETLGKLRHKNIVQILGYCIWGCDRVLIYEFIERGSLDQWLHNTSSSNEELVKIGPLSWDTRIKVVRGVGNGLQYLHGLPTPVIHRDIKASNVLLDFYFDAHIADFGLARTVDGSRSHVSTQVAGTMGYMPPEYKNGVTAASVKADVYSFGILMFEILTGERPNLPKAVDGREMGLLEWVRKMLGQNHYFELLDRRMSRQGLTEVRVKEYFRIATLCTNEVKGDRPLMHQVVDFLDKL